MVAAASPNASVAPAAPLALWGGFECSVTRLHDQWRDQLRETGHHDRIDDLDRAAEVGVTTLRYPFLWERVLREEAEAGVGRWPWHDARMARLRALGLDVVAGLLHHGSGPAGTDLLDPGLPARLARHAGRVAERYPDIRCWTPVNEPLTTARFSCLYGTWYPHRRDTAAFLRATFLQCRGVLLSMRAIRRRVPDARLVQTEDLSRCFATPAMADQAGYENERRWLSLDLLCGVVNHDHPWRSVLLEAGIPAAQLDEMATGEARPDMIAGNHYVTSERFLDHRVALYPASLHGGNGYLSYADTEAVRVRMSDGDTGWLARLREVWERYRIPVVLGEVHLGCDNEAEQARWFVEAWRAAGSLRQEGADVRAVTAWALAGSVDWDSLMQQQHFRQELGLWDFQNDPPRPRALAKVLWELARGDSPRHSMLDGDGWWRRDDRFNAPTPEG